MRYDIPSFFNLCDIYVIKKEEISLIRLNDDEI